MTAYRPFHADQAFTPYAVRATTPAQRGRVHAFERATGCQLRAGFSRGTYHVTIRRAEVTLGEWRGRDLPALLGRAMEEMRNA